jgi:hypothetical protein
LIIIHNTFLVHRLVAFAFIPNPENKPTVDHTDRNKKNNHSNNLDCVYNNSKSAYNKLESYNNLNVVYNN